MKILKLFFIFFFLFSFNHLKANDEDTKNTITKNLRCLICQGQSIYDMIQIQHLQIASKF